MTSTPNTPDKAFGAAASGSGPDGAGPLMQRLERLQAFLQGDPDNHALRVDIFDTAMSAGVLDCAERQAVEAQERQYDPIAWEFRQASLRIAQKRFAEAQQLLRELEAKVGAHPSIAHNLAHIEFQQQSYAACCDLLRPWMDVPVAKAAAPADAVLQVLWLRALHRLGLLEEAWKWVQDQRAADTLSVSAAGIASLIAVDLGDLDEALTLSELALVREPLQMEALVARASVALAQRDLDRARALSARALERNPGDGRAWSASGFAEMLGMNIERAKQHFQQALLWMPKHIGTWHGMGWACLMLKDMTGAKRAFEEALALDRNFAESHGGLAVLLALTGEPKRAAEHIELAMRLDKSNLSAWYAQAILSGEVADAQGIQRLAQRLLGQRQAPMGGTMADWLSKKS